MRWSGAMVAGTLMLFGLAGCGPKAPPPPGKTATSAPAVSEQGFVYTANERGRSISAITLRTGQVRTIAMPFMPHNVQVSSDGRLLLALGSAAEMDATDPAMSMADGSKMVGGRLLMIDTETLAVQSAVDLEVVGIPRTSSSMHRPASVCFQTRRTTMWPSSMWRGRK